MVRTALSAQWLLLLAAALPAQGSRPASARRPDGALDLNELWSRGRAAGVGPVVLTCPPLALADLGSILPYGMMVGGHVCPIDHQYYFPKDATRGAAPVEVRAPARGFVVMIGHRVQLRGSTEKQREYDDYALHIEHSRTVWTFYDLLTALAPELLLGCDAPTRERFATKRPGPPVHVRIAVEAGQVLGKVAGRSLDFGLVDTDRTLSGLLRPASYGHYAWRIHVADPFEYYEPKLRAELQKANPRVAEPRGGRIDYDVAGTLAGNWFVEGSGGYAGNADPRGYWMGHLALVRHHVDPALIVVSIGDFAGRPRQFVVRGNAPDPSRVRAADGLVVYELLNPPLDSRGRPVQLPAEMQGVQGLMLVEVRGDKLVAEALPGKKRGEVEAFTRAARTYVR